MILRSYIQSYHFYDLNAILNVLVRWDCKIMWSYNLDRDFDNHAYDVDWVMLVNIDYTSEYDIYMSQF